MPRQGFLICRASGSAVRCFEGTYNGIYPERPVFWTEDVQVPPTTGKGVQGVTRGMPVIVMALLMFGASFRLFLWHLVRILGYCRAEG